MSPTSSPYQAKVLIAPTASTIGQVLSQPIIQSCQSALAIKDFFSIALSGGSLPSFLGDLPAAFERAGVNPQWEKWHVMLADERMVPSSHDDSNIGSIRRNFTDKVGIPREQVYGIDETLIEKGSDAVAKEYNRTALTRLIKMSARVSESLPANGVGLDCVVLGFGPDGHTCSLFPNHPVLKEDKELIAHIDDSPKPPPSRITLTFPVLNKWSRCVVFCGTGVSKSPILKDVFGKATIGNDDIETGIDGAKSLVVEMNDPAPYPCAMVRPENGNSLIWVMDNDAAAEGISRL